MQMKRHNKCIFLFFFFLMIFSLGNAFAEEEIFAVGKGFRVTRDDLKSLYTYSKAKGFTSTEKEYVRAAVKMRLFCLEARTLGLVEEPKEDISEISVEQMDSESQKYLSTIFNNHPVSDIAIESFYWSYPKFFRNEQSSDENPDEPEIFPLDDDLKKRIRVKIVLSQKSQIIYDLYESLKKEYDVRFCDEGECN